MSGNEGIGKVTGPIDKAKRRLTKVATDSLEVRATLAERQKEMAGIVNEAGALALQLEALRERFASSAEKLQAVVSQAENADIAANLALEALKEGIENTNNALGRKALEDAERLTLTTNELILNAKDAPQLPPEILADMDRTAKGFSDIKDSFGVATRIWDETSADATQQGETAFQIQDTLDEYKGIL